MESAKIRRRGDLGFWAWLYRWRWTSHAVAYLFCIILIGGFLPGFVQLAVSERLSYGLGIFFVMIWLIPLTLYGFYKWKDEQELNG